MHAELLAATGNWESALKEFATLGGDEYFFGDMDDVRLYNRALSEKEVQELYKAESAGVGK